MMWHKEEIEIPFFIFTRYNKMREGLLPSVKITEEVWRSKRRIERIVEPEEKQLLRGSKSCYIQVKWKLTY